MSLPALEALALTFPAKQGHEVFLLVSKGLAPLLETPGAPWKVIEDNSEERIKKSGGWRRPFESIFKTLQRANTIIDDVEWDRSLETATRRVPFDVAISLTRKVPHALAFYRLRIRERYLWNQPELRAFGRPTVAVNQLTRASDPGKVDQVRYFLEMAKGVFEHQMALRAENATWPPAVLSPIPRLELGRQFFFDHLQSACSKLLEYLTKLDGPQKRKETDLETAIEQMRKGKLRFFLVASTSSANTSVKRWPLKNFLEVAMEIAAKRNWMPVFTFGNSASEKITWKELETHLSNWCNGDSTARPGTIRESVYSGTPPILSIPPGKISLAELLAIIDGSQFVLTNDTGPRHMSLALRKPTVTLFGPSPTSRAVHTLHLERAIKLHDECHATCSLKDNFCRYARSEDDPCLCLQAITPAIVNSQIFDFVPDDSSN